jgi:hypothetical protein
MPELQDGSLAFFLPRQSERYANVAHEEWRGGFLAATCLPRPGKYQPPCPLGSLWGRAKKKVGDERATLMP